MRILTVRQPWAWAIIHGGKTVENRVRNIAGSYRGPIAIHAGLADDLEAWKSLLRTDIHAWGRAMDSRESLLHGVIVGVVDLVDSHVVKMSNSGENVCFDNTTPTGRICSGWADSYDEFESNYGHHLVLANPRPLSTPIPFKGALGLRTLPDDVAVAILGDTQ